MAEVARAKFTIKEVDGGYRQLLKNVFDPSEKPVIHVGILAKDGAKPHEEGSALTVADIAAIHEYGLGDAEERSFLRAWFEAYPQQINEATKRMMLQVINGKLDKYDALSQLGAWMSGQIQQFIAANKVQPATSQETNERKGSSVTLIDKGIIRSSISFAITGVKKPPPAKPVQVTGFGSKKSKAARKRTSKNALAGKVRKFAERLFKKKKRLYGAAKASHERKKAGKR